MRGLPPPPVDVCRVQAIWDVNSLSECTTSWWLFAPGVDAATTLQLETLLGDFFLGPLADLLATLPSDVTCVVLRLTRYGTEPFTLSFSPAPNSGLLAGTVALNSALVMTWRVAAPRNGGRTHTYLPLSEDVIDGDRVHLKSISWSQAQAQARLFVQHANAIVSPDGALCVLVALHRASSAAPLPLALMFPVELGDASQFIGTIRRRIRARRPSSTPF